MKYDPSRASRSIAFIVSIFFAVSVLSPGRIFAAADEQQIFANGNDYRVENGPPVATTFKIDQLWLITYFLAYHYNEGKGQTPGTLALKHEDGTLYGPWQAMGGPGLENPTNLYWVCRPHFVLKPGVYTVIDSDPASWSWNGGSGGGIVIIKGRPVAEAVDQPAKTPRVTREPAQPQKASGNVLVSKTIEPSSASQLVVYKDEVGVIIPGGTIENQQTITISPAPKLPTQPSKAFTQLAAYDISMGNIHEFKKPLVIEIAYDPTKIRSDITPDKALSIAWWDGGREAWVNAPFAVDTTRNVVMIPTTHLTLWEVVALAQGWQLYPRAQEHFKIYYDPTVQMRVGDNTGDYILDVSHALEAAYSAYAGADFNISLTYVPASAIGSGLGALGGGLVGGVGGAALGGPGGSLVAGRVAANAAGKIGAVVGAVLVSSQTYVIIDKNTVSAEWNKNGTGEIYVPINFESLQQLYHDMAHEFFHAVQNGYFSTGGSAIASYAGIDRHWWLEATADYAPVAYGLSKAEQLEKIPPPYFQAPLQAESVAGFNERAYITARFIEFMEKRGYSFKSVWDGTSSTMSLIGATPSMQRKLELYLQQSGKSLHELFNDFAADAFFNSNSALDLATGKTLKDSGAVSYPKILSASDSTLAFDVKLPGNYTATLSRIEVGFKDSQAERSLIVTAGAVSEKDKVTVSAFVLPDDKRVQGGVTPKPVPLFSEGGRTTSLTVRKNEMLYIMAVNSQATDVTLSLKVAEVSLAISPATASVMVGKHVNFNTPGVTEKVRWSVPGEGGGTISPEGVYTAPGKAGTYQVEVSLASNPATTAAAMVTVTEEQNNLELKTVKISDTEEVTGYFQGDKLIKRQGLTKLFRDGKMYAELEYQNGSKVHSKNFNEETGRLRHELWYRGDNEFLYQDTSYSWDGSVEFEKRRLDENSKWQLKTSEGEWVNQ